MSVIEDTRQAVQDFIAPELRAISARLDALEQRFGIVDKRFDAMDRRFEAVDRKFERIDGKFDDVDRRAAQRHDEVMAAIARMGDMMIVQERLARIEAKQEMQKQ